MKPLRRMALALALPAAVALAGCGETQPSDDTEMMDDSVDMEQMVEESAPTMADSQTILVADAGLQTPESVLHDTEADVYLVSNINGAPTDVDGNGFISKVSPDGAISALKWVDGQAEGVTLNAPKGLAIKGDTLFVADITFVRAFNRVSGEPLGSWEVPGSTFLNDLTVGADGTVYVSDSGLNPDFSSSGTDAVYRLEDGGPMTVIQDTSLAGPNGLAAMGDELVVVGFSGSTIKTVPTAGGEPTSVATIPGGQLDGVIVLDDGSMLVSSWETSTVYHVPAGGAGEPVAVVEDVPSPADIGWDAERSRILIPVFTESRLELHRLSR
mgnify:CR=1 FL=1